MAHELNVWLLNHHIGKLSLSAGQLNFSYESHWLTRPDAFALSISLPLQAAPFEDSKARPFFAGLLPEGQMRRLIAQQFRVSNQNDFGLLHHIGGECAGAVTFLKPGQQPVKPMHNNDVEWLSDDETIALLEELPRRPMLAGKDGLRLSLAGAQDKLPVIFDGTRIGLPLHSAPSSHILKPAIQGIEESAINEGFCMALADVMQLRPAKSIIRRIRNHAFLLVERYDRRFSPEKNEQHLQRLHQEDFCQALGIPPEMKYQNEGGPSLIQCFDLVRNKTSPSAPQLLRLLDCVIFNVLIGNHDAHAKNFSLLYEDAQMCRSPVLAPFYDLLSTAVYSTLTQKMAMKIGSKYQFNQIQSRHWEQFIESIGFSKTLAKGRILELAKMLPIAARKLQSDPALCFGASTVIEQINVLIEKRCALVIQRFIN